MDFCGLKYCDIFKELQRRHMNSITEMILCNLGVDSIQNVRLVSKAWCAAVGGGNNKIWKKIINIVWDCDTSRHWQRLRRHLEVDFPLQLDDNFYYQRLCNTTQLANVELLKTMGCYFSTDYLPYGRNPHLLCATSGIPCGFHLEKNEEFIVAWDSSVNRLKFWSRRSMKPLPLDEDFTQCETPSGPGLNFCLNQNFLLSGGLIGFQGLDEDLEPGEELNNAEHLCLFYLSEKGAYGGRRLENNTQLPAPPTGEVFLDTAHLGIVGQFMRYIDVQDNFHMIVFSRRRERRDLRVMVWKTDEMMGDPLFSFPGIRLRIGTPWKRVTVPFTAKNHFFMDADYLVVLGREQLSGSTFFVYSMVEREIGEARLVKRLEVKGSGPKQFQYYNGSLITAFSNGMIRFVNVKSGITERLIKTSIDFSAPGNLIRFDSSSVFFITCSASPVRGTNFHFWNLYDPNVAMDVPTSCINAFTGRVVDFKFDILGIVAVMESDGDHGIQVVRFIPHCGHCNVIFAKDRLKSCSRCKLIKYCGTKCQRADWNRHKTFCAKLIATNV